MTVSRVSLAAAALVVLQFLVRLALVPQSYWWQDDFLHLETRPPARARPPTCSCVTTTTTSSWCRTPSYWLLTQVTTDSVRAARRWSCWCCS